MICQSPCSFCFNASYCITCVTTSTLFLENGVCLSCLSPCQTCSGIRSNCTSCDTTSNYSILHSATCLAACPDTYYSDGIQCQQCISPCDTCLNASNTSCLTCKSGYFQLGARCYTVCPDTYFNNITVCSACLSPCATCITSS